jgi:DNA-binding NtrC family response regulator
MDRSIFYLDDDPIQLEVFEQMFGAEYEVRTASTMADALRRLGECSADVIISDQVMPDGRGTDFLRAAARACPESFRVLLTGQITFGEVLPEVGSGVVHHFMPKPWTREQMDEALQRAFSRGGPPKRRGGKNSCG